MIRIVYWDAVMVFQASDVSVLEKIEIKEESREIISQWMPGSGAEDYVVSANIQARKPYPGCMPVLDVAPKSG